MSNPIDEVRQELVGYELEALSLLFHCWAEPANVEKRKNEWGNKMPAFRKAIIAGKETGARKKLEPEIIRAEFACLKTAVEHMQSEREERPGLFSNERELAKLRIPHPINGSQGMFRPFPVPEDALRQIWAAFINRRNDFDVVVHRIISMRFGISLRTVKEYLRNPNKERFTLSINQQLLASVFLDICSDSGNDDKWQGLRAEILYALYMSEPECKLIFLCYLVQTAHRLKTKIFVGEYETKMIHYLCHAVCPDIKKLANSPFLRLT